MKANNQIKYIAAIICKLSFCISCAMTIISYIFDEELFLITSSVYYKTADVVLLLIMIISLIIYEYLDRHEK